MKSTSIERKTNIEILRILAMLMIIGSHYVIHGIQNSQNSVAYVTWLNGSDANKLISVFFLPGGPVGVAIFFMITGYFSIDGRKRSLKAVYASVLFYGILSTIAFVFLGLCNITIPYISIKTSFSFILKSLLIPLTGGTWWFITSYVFLVLASAEINNFLNRLNKSGWLLLLGFCWIFWYGLASFDAPFFQFQKAVFFYVMGVFCRRYPLPHSNLHKMKLLILFIIFWSVASIGYYFTSINKNQAGNGIEFDIIYTVFELIIVIVAVPICSYAIFNIFTTFNLGSKNFINNIGKSSLGIYLFHDAFIFRPIIWNMIFKVDSFQYQSKFFILYALTTIVIVFIVGLVIDLFRRKFIEPFALGLMQRGVDWFSNIGIVGRPNSKEK